MSQKFFGTNWNELNSAIASLKRALDAAGVSSEVPPVPLPPSLNMLVCFDPRVLFDFVWGGSTSEDYPGDLMLRWSTACALYGTAPTALEDCFNHGIEVLGVPVLLPFHESPSAYWKGPSSETSNLEFTELGVQFKAMEDYLEASQLWMLTLFNLLQTSGGNSDVLFCMQAVLDEWSKVTKWRVH